MHHLRRVRVVSLAVLVVMVMAAYSLPLFTGAVSSVRCQGVGGACPCEPPVHAWMQVTRALSVSMEAGFDAFPHVRDGLVPGADYWEPILSSYGRGFAMVDPSAADISVVLAILPDHMLALAEVAPDGTGVLRVNVNNLYYGAETWRHVFAHELGHHLGFNHAACDPSRTVMSSSVDPQNGPFSPALTTYADRCGVQRMVRAEDHPTFSWCYGGGCTPGYSRNCSTGGDRETDECGCCWNFTPILIDLAGDGFAMRDPAHGPAFDVNGLGRLELVSWPAGADDAWLALDVNGNGTIDSGAELFGNAFEIRPLVFASNGYEALASYDANGDDRIDARDPVFGRLLLWLDRNADGRSTLEELQPLARSGIVGISVAFTTTRRVDEWGNAYRYAAPVWASVEPRLRWSVDVFPVRVHNR